MFPALGEQFGVPSGVTVTVDAGGSIQRADDRVTVLLPDAGTYLVPLAPDRGPGR